MTLWYIIGHYTLYNFFWWPVPEVVYHWGTVPNTEIHKTECWCTVTNQKTWLKLPVVQQCQAISESKYTCPYTKDSSFLKEFVVFGWSIFFLSGCKTHFVHTAFYNARFTKRRHSEAADSLLCPVCFFPEYQFILFLQNASPECSSRECFWTFLFFIFSLWNSCRTSTLPLLIDLHCTYLGSGRLLLWIFNYVGVVIEVSPPFFF